MSRVLSYTVPEECAGMTVKDFARKRLGFSTRFLSEQKRTERGIIKNGAPCRTVDALASGDSLCFLLPEETGEYPPGDTPLAVLFENDDYLGVDKPPSMPIHPSPGHDRDSLLNAAAGYYLQTGQRCLFRPLYRLDRDTSGVVLIAKHRAAACAAQLEKRYYAVCQGDLSGSGIIDVPIGLKPGSKIVRECGHGDPSVTWWRALASKEGHTLLSLCLKTGRTHQIRAHLSYLGFPLAGDDLYGGSREIIMRQALHCGLVSLNCPALFISRTLFAPFPEDILSAFPWLRELDITKLEGPLCQPV